MIPFTKYSKSPDATLDYTVDWSLWLEPTSGDTIASVDWEIENGIHQPTGDQYEPFNDTTTATVFLTGGDAGKKYLVTCHMTTAAARVEDFTFIIQCEQT
jgi:hypothetical protein